MQAVQTIGRFILAGGGNTLLTAVVTSALSLVAPPSVAYTVGYAAGLALGTVTASRFVFRRRLTARRAIGVCGVNAVAYLCGLAVLAVSRRLGLPSGMSGLTVLVTAPVSFLGAAAVFKEWGADRLCPNTAVASEAVPQPPLTVSGSP